MKNRFVRLLSLSLILHKTVFLEAFRFVYLQKFIFFSENLYTKRKMCAKIFT